MAFIKAKKKIRDLAIKATTWRINTYFLDLIKDEAEQRDITKSQVVHERLAKAFGISLDEDAPRKYQS